MKSPLLLLVLSCQGLAEKPYKRARLIRINQGHDAAVPMYREILKQQPRDVTAASRIAAAIDAPQHQQDICKNMDIVQAKELRDLFLANKYTNHYVSDLFETTAQANDDSASASSPMQRHLQSTCPIFITAAAAGTATTLPFDINSCTALQCLVALFLVGLCIPKSVLVDKLSYRGVQLLLDLCILVPCELDADLLVPYVQVFPVNVGDSGDHCTNTNLLIITDWHPRVLSVINVGNAQHQVENTGNNNDINSGNAVMYLGPDSIALVQQWLKSTVCRKLSQTCNCSHLIDFCTGSGIHALAALALQRARHAICVDINTRALHFVQCNAMLNGLDDRITTVHGDVMTQRGRIYTNDDNTYTSMKDNDYDSLLDLLSSLMLPLPSNMNSEEDGVLMITANPPFLPVPSSLMESRHGLFSAGGTSGEAIMAGIVDISSKLLQQQYKRQLIADVSANDVIGDKEMMYTNEGDGHNQLRATNNIKKLTMMLSIVSEFFFQPETELKPSDSGLKQRITSWWGHYDVATTFRALLQTNELPISSDEYAKRRADDLQEYNTWKQHLTDLDIATASPGLLCIQAVTSNGDNSETDSVPAAVTFEHVQVPRSAMGSIWTPNNLAATQFVHETLEKFYLEPTIDSLS